MAKTKVKALLDQMEQPFKGMKGKQTKQYAQFMGIITSMMATLGEASAKGKKLNIKKMLEQLSGPEMMKPPKTPKAATPAQMAALAKGRAAQRVGMLREKYGEGLTAFDKEELKLDKESLKEESQIRETLGDMKDEGALVYDAIQNSMFGPLSPLIEKSKNFFKGTIKQWIINWKEVVRKKKLDKEAKNATKMQLHVLKDLVEKYKITDKETSEWAENQLNLLNEQVQKQDDSTKRTKFLEEGRFDWEKKQGKEQIKWTKKSTGFIKDLLVTTRIGMMAGFIKDMAMKAFDFFTDPKVLAAMLGLGLIAKLWPMLKKGFDDQLEHLKKIWDNLKSIAGSIGTMFKTIKDAAVEALSSFYDNYLKKFVEPIGKKIGEMIDWIKQLLHIEDKPGAAATPGVQSRPLSPAAQKSLDDWMHGMPPDWAGTLEDVTTWLKEFLKSDKEKKGKDEISADGKAIVKAIEDQESKGKNVQVNAPTSVNNMNASSGGEGGGAAPGFGEKIQKAR